MLRDDVFLDRTHCVQLNKQCYVNGESNMCIQNETLTCMEDILFLLRIDEKERYLRTRDIAPSYNVLHLDFVQGLVKHRPLKREIIGSSSYFRML